MSSADVYSEAGADISCHSDGQAYEDALESLAAVSLHRLLTEDRLSLIKDEILWPIGQNPRTLTSYRLSPSICKCQSAP